MECQKCSHGSIKESKVRVLECYSTRTTVASALVVNDTWEAMSETDRKTQKQDQQADKPKPCCVCLPEKDERDQCILLNGQDSDKCNVFIEEYKKCMKSYGFNI